MLWLDAGHNNAPQIGQTRRPRSLPGASRANDRRWDVRREGHFLLVKHRLSYSSDSSHWAMSACCLKRGHSDVTRTRVSSQCQSAHHTRPAKCTVSATNTHTVKPCVWRSDSKRVGGGIVTVDGGGAVVQKQRPQHCRLLVERHGRKQLGQKHGI
jgi:hypothetical protein